MLCLLVEYWTDINIKANGTLCQTESIVWSNFYICYINVAGFLFRAPRIKMEVAHYYGQYKRISHVCRMHSRFE